MWSVTVEGSGVGGVRANGVGGESLSGWGSLESEHRKGNKKSVFEERG